MLSRDSKQLLKNIIRHTDTHNRILEEDEMWKQRDTEVKSGKRQEPDYMERSSRRRFGSAYMDESSPNHENKRHSPSRPESTYWMQQLYKANETDPDRWGHSGYKELYPDLFGDKKLNPNGNSSDTSSDDSDSSDRKTQKKRKRKREKKGKKTKKHKKEKKSKKKKERNKKRVCKGDSSSSDENITNSKTALSIDCCHNVNREKSTCDGSNSETDKSSRTKDRKRKRLKSDAPRDKKRRYDKFSRNFSGSSETE